MLTIALLLASDELIPLGSGNEWRFAGTVTAEEQTRDVEFVVRVAEVDGDRVVLEGAVAGLWGFGEVAPAEERSEEETFGDHLLVTDAGVRIVAVDGMNEREEVEGEWLWLSDSGDDDPEWEAQVTIGHESFDLEYRLGEPQEIAVPAGTFTARPLEVTMTAAAEEAGMPVVIRGTLWLAPDVGPVRVEWGMELMGQRAFGCEAELREHVAPDPEG